MFICFIIIICLIDWGGICLGGAGAFLVVIWLLNFGGSFIIIIFCVDKRNLIMAI